MSKNQTINETEEDKIGRYNVGVTEALKLRPEIEKNGHSIKIKYLDELRKGELSDTYKKIFEFARDNHKGVREIFGRKGTRFGKEVLAAVEYEGKRVNNIHPHLDFTNIRTIKDYFEGLLPTDIKGKVKKGVGEEKITKNRNEEGKKDE